VLEIVIVSSAVPPALIELREKLFETVGGDVETVSISAAVQVPAVHDGDELVLVTLDGGEITAVLVTWVWAETDEQTNKKQASTARLAKRQHWLENRSKKAKEQKALKDSKKNLWTRLNHTHFKSNVILPGRYMTVTNHFD
jgi:protein required for attachment to host cells